MLPLQLLIQRFHPGALPGVVETVPTFRSLTVLYDPLVTSRAVLDPQLRALLALPPEELLLRWMNVHLKLDADREGMGGAPLLLAPCRRALGLLRLPPAAGPHL